MLQNSTLPVIQESLYIEDEHHQLHLRHIYSKTGGKPVLMLHGTIENGKIFYTESGKGLACFLANQGFDVFVADFRGKGKSIPSLKEDPEHGQFEVITRDIPLFLDFLSNRCQQKLHVICHSWGGVLFASSLARYPNRVEQIASNICFGTKRAIYQKNMNKFLKVDLFWSRLAPQIAKRKGYIDAVKLKFGADNESHQFLLQSVKWVKPNDWHDPLDSFDYHTAAKQLIWPPTWHITGVNDDLLGHASDVKAFIKESNIDADFSLLSKQAGNKVDYDHIDILTHRDAAADHFPEVVSWINKYS